MYYNAFVPIFLANKFHLAPAFIGFFMTLDNIAALFIQPPVGAWSDRLRTPMGRRLPFILIGAPITATRIWIDPDRIRTSFVCGLHEHTVVKRGIMANAGCRPDA